MISSETVPDIIEHKIVYYELIHAPNPYADYIEKSWKMSEIEIWI